MDIISFQQEDHWYGVLLGTVADLVPTVTIDSPETSSSAIFGIVQYRQRSLAAVRIGALVWPERYPGPARPGPGRTGRLPMSLLVVGRGARLIGLPSESVACILDVSPERMMTGIAAAERGVSLLRLQYLDSEITVLDTFRLIRLTDLSLGRLSSAEDREYLISQPC